MSHIDQRGRARQLHFVTFSNPFGEQNGSQLRALHILRALQAMFRVRLMLADAGDCTPDDIRMARDAWPDVRLLHIEYPRDRSPLAPLRRNLTRDISRSFRMRCHEAEQVRRSVAADDLIWCFGVRAAAFLGLDPRRTFVDVDDVPSQVLALERPHLASWSDRALCRVRIARWKARERHLPHAYAGVGVCSETDRRYLGSHPGIYVIPNGFAASGRAPARAPSVPPRIGFIGQISYKPNAQGLSWFVRDVWPRIKARIPELRLRVAGRGDLDAGCRGPDIDLLGYLDDPTDEIASWSLMVVPIFTGGGTRIKIPHAFSQRCPVVSTPFGAYGFDVAHEQELLLAESAADFAHQCMRTLARPDDTRRRAEAAYRHFQKEMTCDVTARRVGAAVRSALLRDTSGVPGADG
jgi:glycosyltransferase involved in cell wall biosynthesis